MNLTKPHSGYFSELLHGHLCFYMYTNRGNVNWSAVVQDSGPICSSCGPGVLWVWCSCSRCGTLSSSTSPVREHSIMWVQVYNALPYPHGHNVISLRTKGTCLLDFMGFSGDLGTWRTFHNFKEKRFWMNKKHTSAKILKHLNILN